MSAFDNHEPRRPNHASPSQASDNWRVKADTTRPDAPSTNLPVRHQLQQSSYKPERTKPPPLSERDQTPGNRLYVGNLLYSAQPKHVEQLFLDNGYAITNINMSLVMQELNGKEILGRPVKIKPGVEKLGTGTTPRVKTARQGWLKPESPSTCTEYLDSAYTVY
jgi:RNA recognition motif-containing protein